MRTNDRWPDGAERLRISSGRGFRFHGRRFWVGDLAKQDRKNGDKYLLYEIKNDREKIMHDKFTCEMLTFKTIKDARQWVRDSEPFTISIF